MPLCTVEPAASMEKIISEPRLTSPDRTVCCRHGTDAIGRKPIVNRRAAFAVAWINAAARSLARITDCAKFASPSDLRPA